MNYADVPSARMEPKDNIVSDPMLVEAIQMWLQYRTVPLAYLERVLGASFVSRSVTAPNLDEKRAETFKKLKHVYEDHKCAGWDGYRAEPISSQTYQVAEKFLKSLPTDIPPPSIGAEADGHLTFEWYRTPDLVLSVSIDPQHQLHYAALLGGGRQKNGTEQFKNSAPDDILSIIRGLYSSQA
jgi:hypothetical protein